MKENWLMLHTWAGNLPDVPMTGKTKIEDYVQIKPGWIVVIQSGPIEDLMNLAKQIIDSNWSNMISFKPDYSRHGIKYEIKKDEKGNISW